MGNQTTSHYSPSATASTPHHHHHRMEKLPSISKLSSMETDEPTSTPSPTTTAVTNTTLVPDSSPRYYVQDVVPSQRHQPYHAHPHAYSSQTSTPSSSSTTTTTTGNTTSPSSFLPPPSTTTAYLHECDHPASENNTMYGQNVVSPPLTPAVSPSSMLLDSMQFKRKCSVDAGSLNFGHGITEPQHSSSIAYRRYCHSTMSVHNYVHEPRSNYANTAMSPPTSSGPSSSTTSAGRSQPPDYAIMHSVSSPQPMQKPANHRRQSSKGANANSSGHQGLTIQHKHVCTYAYCGWSFKRFEHLKRHMLVHTGERPHVCPYPGCGKSFSRSDNFHAHYRTHAKKSMQHFRVPASSSCSRPTSASAAASVAANAAATASVTPNFDTLHRSHSTYYMKNDSFDMMSPYSSDMYGHRQMYPTSGMLSTHDYAMQQQEQQQAPPLPPPPSSSSHYMRSFHMPMPSGIGPFGAVMHGVSPSAQSMSASSTPESPSLLNHTLSHQTSHSFFSPTSATDGVHRSDSPYAYSMNSLVSPTTGNGSPTVPAPYHTSAHVGVPPITGRRSASVSSVSSNGQIKSHICPVPQCQRRFKRLEHLKRHMRIHTLERPFACSFPSCHKTFSRSDNLSQHMKTHQRHENRRCRQSPHRSVSYELGHQSMPLHHSSSMTNTNTNANAMTASTEMNWIKANAGTVGC
ncbi:uncharacterized protein BYT42DRAFT_608787 [Radiomyces spectabilis]|uniref:uncharacterized protein n=1 Tax=Radiomyces spectabilis TaxID=64574 RepID=UPI002220942A|nr:uncharacterized protein BYT42DRAFT_608787 [Radiomyces spectabilis]KAI8365271.1 hypothetical protein BYT42DRAFT_608787 [Radiomyces spectabilis]